MLCDHPFYRSTTGITEKGLILSSETRLNATPFGCGQCLHCRINQGRVWTQRIMLEQKCSADSAFVTLTYSDEFLPDNLGLVKSHYQNYIKRVRKAHEPAKLRFFGIGEYGENTYRPHYHVAFFSKYLNLIHRQLDECWSAAGLKIGHTQIGEINDYSARYIAGYTTAKLTKRFDPHLEGRPKEFMTSSRRNGGIGYPAIKKIAEAIKNNKYADPKKIVKELAWGKKKIPLGRYLMTKLIEELGQDHRELAVQLWDAQQEMFLKHKDKLDPTGKSFGLFMASVVEEEETRKLSLKKKHKIYKQRRQL